MSRQRPKQPAARRAAAGSAVLWRAVLIVVLLVAGLWAVGRLWATPATAPPSTAPVPSATPPATPPPSTTPPASPPPATTPPAVPESGPVVPPPVPTPSAAELSDKELPWGFVRNSTHQMPGITAATQALLDQYHAFWLGPTDKKAVYLTFDNGYDVGLTPRILTVLKKHVVKGIFFFTGSNMKQNPDLVKQIVAEGHAIGNHTMNHPNLARTGAETFEREVEGVDELYFSLTGKHLHYFRPPSGIYSEAVLARLQAKGYRTAFWSVAMRDWEPLPGGKDEALHGVLDHLHPGAVVLLHSVSKDVAAALDEIITQTLAAGYSFGDPTTL